MTLRIEFSESKSHAFKNVLRIAKRFKTFRQFEEDGLTIYSVEFQRHQLQAFEALRQMTGWKGRAIYLDGHLIDRGTVSQIVYDALYKPGAAALAWRGDPPGLTDLEKHKPENPNLN